ncbi:MAG TPA: phosphatidate cytidylyltransferase [Planctomycetota bacterium]|nr:phosphatidate cytidylyltransferase [Planctomycetota bacterium]
MSADPLPEASPSAPSGTPGDKPAPAPAAAPVRVSGMRVGVGLLLGVVAVLVILLDGILGQKVAFRSAAPGTGLLIALLSAAALRELYALLAAAGIPSHAGWGALASFSILALRALLPAAGIRPGDAEAFAWTALALAAVLPVAGIVGFRPEADAERPSGPGPASAEALRPVAGTALGLLLVHLPMALLLELRLVPAVPSMASSIPAGLALATMAVLACKAGDSAAYFVGRTVGRRPLCWVSPKKTWEGAIAGAAAGTVAAGLLGGACGLPLPVGLGFGLAANLAGQGGDLLESWLKRCCGAKDSGDTFGEMGGALDLVDALLLAGPAAYLFHRVVIG